MPDLFISYARADSRDFVARLSAALEERGKDTWVDLDDIPAASVWSEDLRAGIATSDSFCFVISPASVTSEHCRTELDHAVALNKRLLPVLHLPAADGEVPPSVGARNWIPQTGRFLDDFDGNLDTLVSAIETDLDWVREHTRWGLRADEWVRREEDHSLLARGSDLDQAEAFLGGGGGREPQPTELQGRYVLASRRAASRRQRLLVTGVSVALVVSLVLGVLALLQRNTAVAQRHEADKQRHEAQVQSAAATSKALAANAFLNLPTDPELSLLLGLEAAKASPTTEAENALRSALLDSQVRLQLRHGAAVTSASYSPDGTKIVTTSEDGTAALWDVATGDQIAVLGGNTQPPQVARWSADGSRLVTISQDGSARVYDGTTGAAVSVITPTDENRLTDVAISADGAVVVTAAFVNGQVHAWNADDGTLLGTIPRSTVDRIALSPDNSLLLVAMQGVGVELWSTADSSLVGSYPEDAQGFFDAAAFSPDGSRFVTAGEDGFARVRTIDGTLVTDVKHNGTVEAVAFSPDGNQLATASEDGIGEVTDLTDGRTLATLAGHGALDTIAFSPAGNLVATGGEEGVVRLWRPNGGAEVATLVGHQAPIQEVTFSPSGGIVLSASDDSTARLWTTTGSAGAFPQRLSSPAKDAFGEAFAADGRYAVLAVQPDLDAPSTVRTLDVETGDLNSEFTLSPEDYFVPALSADGTLTMTTDYDSAAIRHTSDGSVVAKVPVARPYDAAFDATGQRVLVGGDKGSVGIYDTTTGELRTALEGHDPAFEVIGTAFSADGSRALTASADGTARIWDADTGKQLLDVPAFEPPTRMYLQHAAVSLSPDGHVLATSAEYEADVQLWNADTGEHLATLEGAQGGSVSDLAFSADGRFVLTASLSGAVRLWDGHSGRLLAAVTDTSADAGAATFTDRSRIAVVGQFNEESALVVLDCDVCGDLGSLVELAKTRVTRDLTDSEKATYLSGD